MYCVEMYIEKDMSTMTTNDSRLDFNWGDVQSYGEILAGRGDVSALETFTTMLTVGQSSQGAIAEDAPGQLMSNNFTPYDDLSQGRSNVKQLHTFDSPPTHHPQYASGQGGA